MSTISTKVSYDKKDIEDWLSVNEDASELHLLKEPGRNKTSPIWRLYHVVFGVQEDADPEDLSDKWKEKGPSQQFACCNKCGALVSIGNNNKVGKFKQTTAGLNSHIENVHHFTLETIKPKIDQYEIDTDTNPDRQAKRQKAAGPQGPSGGNREAEVAISIPGSLINRIAALAGVTSQDIEKNPVYLQQLKRIGSLYELAMNGGLPSSMMITNPATCDNSNKDNKATSGGAKKVDDDDGSSNNKTSSKNKITTSTTGGDDDDKAHTTVEISCSPVKPPPKAQLNTKREEDSDGAVEIGGWQKRRRRRSTTTTTTTFEASQHTFG